MLEAQFRSHGLAIELDLGKNLPVVLANPFSLEEVLLNLLSNARDALDQSSQDGAITAPPRVLLRTSASQNADGTPQIEIQVNDTGVGIAPDIIDKVFDPFFTTKDPDKGTGLGLAVSKSIVEDFGGDILIQSNSGDTTIIVSLPAIS